MRTKFVYLSFMCVMTSAFQLPIKRQKKKYLGVSTSYDKNIVNIRDIVFSIQTDIR